MDLTLYLFDSRQQLRQVIAHGIVQCIHGERSHTLSAELPTRHAAKPGEYLGLRCVDGRFRLFCIEYADEDDNTALTRITAKDAAVDELDGTVVSVEEPEEEAPWPTAYEAAKGVLDAIGWKIGKNETDAETAQMTAGMMSAWQALTEIETAHNLHMQPYYTFDGARITGKTVDIMAKIPVYRGRFVERGSDAEGIVISRGKRPKPKIFPLGPDGMTIADVAWDKDKGDPVTKPAGQIWIGVPEAVDAYGGRAQVVTFDEATDPNDLAQKAWAYAKKCTKPEITATAIISDMEMIAGQTWKSVRLWDLVRVRPKYGEDVLEQIIDIARNYIRHHDTKITLGKEPDSAARAISRLADSTKVMGEKVGSRLRDMLVTVEELDEYTRTTITDAWVELKAGMETSFAEMGARVDRMDQDIATGNELTRKVSEAVVTLQGNTEEAIADIRAKHKELSDGFLDFRSNAYAHFKATTESALATIGASAEKANKDLSTFKSGAYAEFKASTESAFAGITAEYGDKIATMWAQVGPEGSVISLKADITEVDRLVAKAIAAEFAAIMEQISAQLHVGNLTAMTFESSTIDTTLLDVSGEAIVSGNLYAEKNLVVSGDIDMTNGDLISSGVTTDSLTYKGELMALQEANAINSIYLPYHVGVNVRLADGETMMIYAFTQRPQVNIKPIKYLGPSTDED